MTIYTLASVVEKSSKKRRPFVILGEFSDRAAFITALEDSDFPRDEYDYRTLRLHEEVSICDTGIMSLHTIDDELTIS